MKPLALCMLLLISTTLLAQTSAPPSTTAPQRIQVPEAWEMGNLLEVVPPGYPEEARKQSIGGKVVLKIAVDKQGTVIEAIPAQGDPLLAEAAVVATRKWKFRPYIRDTQKVEVESTVTLEFIAETGEVRTPEAHTGPLRLRVSAGVAHGLKIKDVEPEYPANARSQHIQGDVILAVTIDKEGNTASIKTIQGDPLLVAAAIKAVSQWKYRPYVLNGDPVELETTIKIAFHF
jgi:TonB family protein